ncbi:uncharacterized protein LOC121408831 isoform X3 [Lytechinus variegatus]|uniref:uncharacterized protein LOC121408831 isoform X3 n=1 Tax=Lytechinus variegatus TaxID=7654 RepID=UPI001BB1CDBB|nr:uncharacterized protein LOC121408831 isoform X3 [Lytechinus variegatus]
MHIKNSLIKRPSLQTTLQLIDSVRNIMETKDSATCSSKVTRSGRHGGDQTRRAVLSASSGVHCEFLLSGFKEEREKKELMKKIRALGGRTKNEMTYVSRCTHVISYRPIRSEKFLCGIAGGKWVLKPEFITDSSIKGRWLEESKYEWGEGDVSLENVLPGLLTAPGRWRKKVAATGQGAFHNWKVLLHVTNQKNREAVYKRVLEAGGGQCYTVTFPIEDPARVASLVTHVIVDKCYEEHVKCLEARGVPCVLPEFIAEHLFQESPDIAKLKVSSTLMTPTQTKRQGDVVVSTVSTKKAGVANKTPQIDTFMKPTTQTRSREKQTNLQEGERETPGSTTSIAEETTMSDPGRGVKRKLHFSPNQLREALQILKKRKLSSQHLPLVPYTMLIPRPKKTFQCASDDCPSRPFPATICNSIEANIEENHWMDALSCIGSSVSTHLYPPPNILYHIMQNMLQSTSLTVCCSAVFILKQVLCLHSPACYPSLRKLYLDSMAPPPQVVSVTYHNAHWHFVDAVIRRALDGQLVIKQDTEHKDEEDVKVAMETAEMLLHFLVSLFEEDYLSSASEGTERWRGVSDCMLARILWVSSIERSSSKVPINIQWLIHHFLQAVKMAAKCDDWKPVTSLLSTLMLMAADIHSSLGEQPGNSNTEKRKKEFAEKLASKAKQEGILVSKSRQEMFFSMLKPSWLLMGVAECLLQNYDDRLLGGERAFWVEQPLTLRKIVSYYFYLVPPTAGPVMKERSGDGKGTPLKTISNQQQLTCKSGLVVTNASPKSSPKASPKASPRKGNVNRKNPRGETPLHTACIKNKVETVRELLSEPDIDINARDNAEWTPLHEACNHGHTDCVKELLEFAPGKRKTAGPLNKSLDLLAAPSECGTTPLHDAVNTNQVEVVKLLVEAGGRSLLTMTNKVGLTPVELALTKDMKEALACQRPEVSRLPAIDENSNKRSLLTIKNKDGGDAENASRGQSNQQEDTFKKALLMSKSSPKSSPRKNVNRKNPRGETPLHTACIKNKVETVRELLSEPDIDINARDNVGWTPLHEACNHGHTDCVKELLEFAPGKRKTALPQSKYLDFLAAPSECGTTPLHDAVNNNQIEAVKLLVEAGGRSLLTMKNKLGFTPLDLAFNNEDMKKALLGQRSEVSSLPDIDKENENKENLLQPHPSTYRQLLGPPATSTSGYVTEEESEAFAGIVMAMLQSYVRSHNLHRVKAEVDIIKGQKRVVNSLRLNGGNASVSETTPFVSVLGSPSISKAGLPHTPSLNDPVYTENVSSVEPLLEDMEVFMELSRHTEGLKAHLRQISPTQEPVTSTKSTITLKVSRSMRLITHLCAVVS